MTQLIYLQHPSLFETFSTITNTDKDNKGHYVILDRTIFYPQGGGQPADQGKMIIGQDNYDIHDVRNVDGEIRHYIDRISFDIKKNVNIKIIVDKQRRELNTRYHTAGHLIGAIAEKISSGIVAIKGHQFPGEAYIEFNGEISDADNFIEKLQTVINNQMHLLTFVRTKDLIPEQAAILAKSLPYELPKSESLRICHIEGFAPVPCGGTHVSDLKEIGIIIIQKCKSKEGKTKIFYKIDK